VARAEIKPLVRDRRPLYIQAVEPILKLVTDRQLKPGDRLPSEVELAAIFGVGRSTIREAIRHLELSGLVERRRGIGTVLVRTEAPVEMGLERLESLETLAGRQGWQCGTTNVEIGAARATPEQAERLQIEPEAPVSVITRIKTRDSKPFAEMISIVPAAVIPFDDLKAMFGESITDLMDERRRLRYARAAVSAVACDRARAEHLEIPVGEPLIVVDEVFVGDRGEILAWNLLYFVPGGLRLEVLRRLDPLKEVEQLALSGVPSDRSRQ
jgi:GntR family transcriptional regulator